jgi:hypothetical protein
MKGRSAALAALSAVAMLLLIASTATAAGKPTSDLELRVAALEAQVAALTGQVNTLSSTVAALDARLTQVESNPVLALGPYLAFTTSPVTTVYGQSVFGTSAIVSGVNLVSRSDGGQDLLLGFPHEVTPRVPSLSLTYNNPYLVLKAEIDDISWTTYPDLAGVRFYKATSPEGPYTLLSEWADRRDWYSAEDYDLVPGVYYYYRAASYDLLGNESELSNIVTFRK